MVESKASTNVWIRPPVADDNARALVLSDRPDSHSRGSCLPFSPPFILSPRFSSLLNDLLALEALAQFPDALCPDFSHHPLTPIDFLMFLDDYDHDFTARYYQQYYQHDQVHPLPIPRKNPEMNVQQKALQGE